MKLCEHGGYEIHIPTSGGKAGKGYAKTSSIQVRSNSCIVKQFRYVVANPDSRKTAFKKATEFIHSHPKPDAP